MKKQKNKKNKKSKARERYEDKNPVVSIRIPMDWYNTLQKLKEEAGISYRMFLGIAIEKIAADYGKACELSRDEGYKEGFEKGRVKGYGDGYFNGNKEGSESGYNKGYNEGHNKGVKEYAIYLPCYKCGKDMIILPGSWSHKEIKDWMGSHFCHRECPR